METRLCLYGISTVYPKVEPNHQSVFMMILWALTLNKFKDNMKSAIILRSQDLENSNVIIR